MPGILHAQRPRQVHLSGSLAYSSSSSFMNLLSAGKEQLPTTHLPTKCCIRLEGYWRDTPPVFGLRVIWKGQYGSVHQHMDSEIHDRADCYLAVRVICKGACCAYALIVRFFFF